MPASRTARSHPIPPLAAGGCQVWWATASAAAPHLLDLLDADERRRHRTLLRDRDRALFLVAHALARIVAGRHVAVPAGEVGYVPSVANRKPRLCGPAAQLELSISHSGDLVVVAISRGIAIGVDVERVKDGYEPSLAQSVLQPSEQRSLMTLDEADRRWGFCRYWTRKEAILKATGDGLGVSPELIAVTAPSSEPALVDWQAPGRPLAAVVLYDLDGGPGYAASLAAIGGPLACTEHDAGPLLE